MQKVLRSCLAVCSIAALGPALVACSSGPSTPDEFDDISARVYCESLIKQQLRDPDSYRFESASVVKTSGTYNQYGEALVKFRSKNGFGGYTSGMATCTAYEKNGDLWHRAKVIN